jgi:sorbitol/mannitol transport system substrate-binding protein
VLRQRVTTDIATKGGQFDIMTIGTYEVPIWASRAGSCRSTISAPTMTSTTCCRPSARGLTGVDGKLYAAPFYGESSMVMYRTDLFEKAGLTMPGRRPGSSSPKAAAR